MAGQEDELITVRSADFTFIHPSKSGSFFLFFSSFLHLPSPHPSSLRGAVTLHPSLSCGTLFGLTPCHICQEQVAGGTDRWSENKCKSWLGRIFRQKATVVFDPSPPRTRRGESCVFKHHASVLGIRRVCDIRRYRGNVSRCWSNRRE